MKRKRSLQVVLTREEKASVDMSIRLRELRFKPIIFPTVQFTRVYSDYTGPQNFSQAGWIVFSTSRAVQYFFKRFKQKIDSGVKLCVIGESTRSELNKLNYNETLFLPNALSSTLASGFENIEPCKIVFTCAKSNSSQLTNILGPKGFEVKELPLYTTEIPAEIDETKFEIIKNGYYDVITFASVSAIKHLMMILQGKVSIFKGKTAIVLSPEQKKFLVGSSFDNIICAKKPNEEGIIESLVEYRESLR